MRAVFHAAGARAQATLAASRQLSSLAVFKTWHGATGEARKHQNALIRNDLDVHGNEGIPSADPAVSPAGLTPSPDTADDIAVTETRAHI